MWGELIWVGNTLLPRGVVWGVIGLAVLMIVAGFTWITAGED